jgi:DNA-directed RNA polymerase III subunit RPC6
MSSYCLTLFTHRFHAQIQQLETSRLIKPIKAVTAKTKKLYMLYDLSPSKEITGGPWYSDYEFDHEFIAELRNFILMCIRRMNGGYGVGNGVTLRQIANKMIQANVSRIQLSLEEVSQVLQTLVLDYLVEQRGVTEGGEGGGEALFVAAKQVTTMCDFEWWDVLSPDFHFRGIRFEDGVYLPGHEPHYHS